MPSPCSTRAHAGPTVADRTTCRAKTTEALVAYVERIGEMVDAEMVADDCPGWGVRVGRVVGAPDAEFSGRGHVDRTVRRAWERAGVDRSRWHGRPLHCARHMLETELGPQVPAAVLNWYIGHADVGVGPRTYRDRGMYAERLWPQLQALAEAVPAPMRAGLVLGAADGRRGKG